VSVLRCQLLGHRYRFAGDGATMRWHCERGCGAQGSKQYRTAEDARRYAAAFDLDDRESLGQRAPVGLSPLRLLRAIRRRPHSGS
jgi:hypothetical protein